MMLSFPLLLLSFLRFSAAAPVFSPDAPDLLLSIAWNLHRAVSKETQFTILPPKPSQPPQEHHQIKPPHNTSNSSSHSLSATGNIDSKALSLIFASRGQTSNTGSQPPRDPSTDKPDSFLISLLILFSIDILLELLRPLITSLFSSIKSATATATATSTPTLTLNDNDIPKYDDLDLEISEAQRKRSRIRGVLVWLVILAACAAAMELFGKHSGSVASSSSSFSSSSTSSTKKPPLRSAYLSSSVYEHFHIAWYS
ncbi:MAG: hypothetical protein Q9160_000488 [Pyrenula sp. 1 TL-2023]